MMTRQERMEQERDQYNALRNRLPEHQRQFVPDFKAPIDAHLDPEFRSDRMPGAAHDRLLANILCRIRRLDPASSNELWPSV